MYLQLWLLANGRDIFVDIDSDDGTYSPSKHLGRMIAVLGHPTKDFVLRQNQAQWKWSPAIRNRNGELCQSARAFFNGPFFNTDGKSSLSW
jgi:hypothetical protein